STAGIFCPRHLPAEELQVRAGNCTAGSDKPSWLERVAAWRPQQTRHRAERKRGSKNIQAGRTRAFPNARRDLSIPAVPLSRIPPGNSPTRFSLGLSCVELESRVGRVHGFRATREISQMVQAGLPGVTQSANCHWRAQPLVCPNPLGADRRVLSETWRGECKRREFPVRTDSALPGVRRVRCVPDNSLRQRREGSFSGFGGAHNFFVPARVVAFRERHGYITTDNGAKRAALREHTHVNMDHEIPDRDQRGDGV